MILSGLGSFINLLITFTKIFTRLTVANDRVFNVVLLEHARGDLSGVSALSLPMHVLAREFKPCSLAQLSKRADRRKRWSHHQMSVVG